jgi:hypothetical protein
MFLRKLCAFGGNHVLHVRLHIFGNRLPSLFCAGQSALPRLPKCICAGRISAASKALLEYGAVVYGLWLGNAALGWRYVDGFSWNMGAGTTKAPLL